MKKLNRFIAVTVVMIMMCMLLCSCSTLDTMKEQHAYWTNENSIDSITLSNCDEYIRIENSSEIMLNQNTWFPIYVTTKDVPVLLSDTLCHYAGYDPNRDLITLSFAEESTEHLLKGSYGFTIGFDARYCNAEDYEKYTANINNNKADRIGFKYSFYSDYNFYETIEAGGETLSKEVLAHVANNKNMTADTYKEIKNALYSESYSDVMLLCDEYAVNISVLGDESYTIEKDKNGEAYLINEMSETAVKLSDEATAQLKNEYFLSSFDSSVDYIGYDDSESDIQ